MIYSCTCKYFTFRFDGWQYYNCAQLKKPKYQLLEKFRKYITKVRRKIRKNYKVTKIRETISWKIDSKISWTCPIQLIDWFVIIEHSIECDEYQRYSLSEPSDRWGIIPWPESQLWAHFNQIIHRSEILTTWINNM